MFLIRSMKPSLNNARRLATRGTVEQPGSVNKTTSTLRGLARVAFFFSFSFATIHSSSGQTPWQIYALRLMILMNLQTKTLAFLNQSQMAFLILGKLTVLFGMKPD